MRAESWPSPVLETRINVKSSCASLRVLEAAAGCPGLINVIESQELLKQKGIWAMARCLLLVSARSGSSHVGTRVFL